MSDCEKQLENVDAKDINTILVSPKIYETLKKKKTIQNITGFNQILFDGLRIQASNLCKDDEFIIIPHEIVAPAIMTTEEQIGKLLHHGHSQKNFENLKG